MRGIDLIRDVGGCEVPAAGVWGIPAGLPLVLVTRRRWRSSSASVRTIGGCLSLADSSGSSELHLATAGDVDDCSRLDVWAAIESFCRDGTWLCHASALLGEIRFAGDLVVRYQGVYRRGDMATAWLDIDAALIATPDDARGRRVTTRLRFTGHLDVTAPLPDHAS